MPLEKQFDNLTLHTGVKFPVPFDCILVFATNLNPRDLVDEAFLRRIQFKVEVRSPDRDAFTKIMRINCAERGIEYSEEAIEILFSQYYEALGFRPRGCHPRDILHQIHSLASFKGDGDHARACAAASCCAVLLPRNGGGIPGRRPVDHHTPGRDLMANDKDGSADVGMMREIDDRMRARMTSLERQVSGLRTRSLFLTLILIAFVAAGVVVVLNPALLASALMSGGAGELSVTRLVLVDEAGTPRGEWSVDGEGNARLSLLDQQNRQRLNLTVLANGFPGLSLSNAQEQRRAVLGLLPDGTSTLVFADASGGSQGPSSGWTATT